MNSSFTLLLITAACMVGCTLPAENPATPKLAEVIASDDFTQGLSQWSIELAEPGTVRAVDGVLDIDVPAGATVWFKPKLSGRIAIEFDATAIAAGGPNDRVSDMNVFWMARNKDGLPTPFAHPRSGKFEDYNTLLTYYVGLGGNSNSTTRFRRYIGDPVTRPLLPEHDLSNPEALLIPNRKQKILLIADGSRIEFWRDGVRLLHYQDPEPYTYGWFAIRTVQSHLRIEHLRVRRLADRKE